MKYAELRVQSQTPKRKPFISIEYISKFRGKKIEPKMPADQIEYSEKYFDSQYEYRLVFPLKIFTAYTIKSIRLLHFIPPDMLSYRMTWRVKCQKRIL